MLGKRLAILTAIAATLGLAVTVRIPGITNPQADAGTLMRRLLGRRGKGGGHGRTAGGWIDVAKVPPAERRAVQREVAARLAGELKKEPGKMAKVALETGRRG